MAMPKRLSVLVALLLVYLAGAARAGWEVDGGASIVNFISIKNLALAETHSFGSLAGVMDDDGRVEVVIDLDSVKTMIPIRNQRMRELLFETGRFPSAKISAQLDEATLSALSDDAGPVDSEVKMTVDLHGTTASYPASVTAFRRGDGAIEVLTRRPVLVRAGDFGLEGGIEALRSVAGLDNIVSAVPVSAHLVLTPVTGD